jgi:hypothetical protein
VVLVRILQRNGTIGCVGAEEKRERETLLFCELAHKSPAVWVDRLETQVSSAPESTPSAAGPGGAHVADGV